MSASITWEPWRERKAVLRTAPHAFTRKVLHWSACSRCGLIALRNEVTRAAMRRQCVVWEDVS